MGKIALCVGKECEVCYIMYGGGYQFLNSVEIRQSFECAKVGQWFRVNTEQRKGQHIFEPLEESDAPPTRILQHKNKSVIQVQLPIFFVSSRENDQQPDFRIVYSPVLDGRSLPIENYANLDDIEIKPWILYEAFLTLKGWEVGSPRWSLQTLSDIVMKGNNLGFVSQDVSNCILSHLTDQKEVGVILKLFSDSCLALILCLRDGQLAIAISEAVYSFAVGDYVHFFCREVDCPVHPSLTSSKLFAFDLSLEHELLEGASFRLKVLEDDKLVMFELTFPITNSMVSSAFKIRGSIHIDNLGALLDPDGLLSSQLTLEQLGQLVIVHARLCLISERQSPLWFIINVIYVEKQFDKIIDEQHFDCTDDDDDFRSEKTLSQKQYKQKEIVSEANDDNAFDLIDGGFGGGWKGPGKYRVEEDLKREEQINCVQDSLNASIGASSIDSNESIRSAAENLPMSEAIALFLHIRSYEWILALFDTQIKKFTHWCCTLIKSLPLTAGQRSPIPGSWFKIGYAFYDTHQIRRVQKHILISSILPVHNDELLPLQINPNNKEVWKMVINGKFECAMNGGGTNKINKPPIPVTNVFAKKKDQNCININNNNRSPNEFNCGPINSKTTTTSQNDPHLSNKSQMVERFFNVDFEMAGIVVVCLPAPESEINAKNNYRVWPFCTDISTPRELILNTFSCLELGTWIKFNTKNYNKGEIETFSEIAHWLNTKVIKDQKTPKVCLECSIQIPQKYDPLSEVDNAIWTCRFMPKNPRVPFIKKLVPTDGLKPYLERYRGKFGLFARLDYRREFDRGGRTVGFWQIADLLT